MDSPQLIVKIDHSNEFNTQEQAEKPQTIYAQNPTPISEVLVKLFPDSVHEPEIIIQRKENNKSKSSNYVNSVKKSLVFQQLKTAKQMNVKFSTVPKTKYHEKLDPVISYMRNIGQIDFYNDAIMNGVYLAIVVFCVALLLKVVF